MRNTIKNRINRRLTDTRSAGTGVWFQPGTFPCATSDLVDDVATQHGLSIPSFDTGDPEIGSDPYAIKSQAIRLTNIFEQGLRQLSRECNSVVAVSSVSGTARAIGAVADPYHAQPVHAFQILGNQLHDFDGSRQTFPPKRALQTALNLSMLEPGDIIRDHAVNDPLIGFGEAARQHTKELCGLAFIDQFNLADRYWGLSATFTEIGDIAQPTLATELDRIVNESTPEVTPGDWAPWLDNPPATPPSGGAPRAVALLPEAYDEIQGQVNNDIRPVHLDIEGRIGVIVLHPIDHAWVDNTLRRGGLRWLYNCISRGTPPIAPIHANMARRAGRADPVAAFEDWVDTFVPLETSFTASPGASPPDSRGGRTTVDSTLDIEEPANTGEQAQNTPRTNGERADSSSLFDTHE